MLELISNLARRNDEALGIIVLENVTAFLDHKDSAGSPWQVLIKYFAELLPNFTAPVVWFCNAVDYGCPQDRARIFIVSFQRKLADAAGGVPWQSPPKMEQVFLGDFLVHL